MIAVILGKGALFRVEFWVSDGDFMESRDPNQSSWESKQGLVGIGLGGFSSTLPAILIECVTLDFSVYSYKISQSKPE